MEYSPTQIELPFEEIPKIPRATIGSFVVDASNRADRSRLEAAHIADRLEWAAELRHTKVGPHDGLLRYGLAKLRGNATTKDERAGLRRAALHDSDDIEALLRSAGEDDAAIANDLRNIRKRFSLLTDSRSDDIDAYLDAEAPPFLKLLAGRDKSSARSWSSWLADATTGANNATLLNFLQWNVLRSEQRQDNAEFVDAVRAEREAFAAALPKAVTAGIFSPAVLSRLHAADETRVWIADPIEATMRRILGARDYDGIVIKVPTDGTTITEEVAHTVPHEFSHDVIDNTYLSPMETRWIKEALTEVSTRALNPARKPNTYPSEIDLYTYLLENGSMRIGPNIGTLAFSGGDTEKQVFYDRLDRSWGISDVLKKVTDYIHAREAVYSDTGIGLRDAQEAAVLDTLEALQIAPSAIFGIDYTGPVRATQVHH